MSVLITFRADEDLKTEAEAVFRELGLNMTTALNMFLRAAVRERTLPIPLNLPSTDQEAALSDHEAALQAAGITQKQWEEIIASIPVVDAFPADWYNPDDDDYAEELCRLSDEREARRK